MTSIKKSIILKRLRSELIKTYKGNFVSSSKSTMFDFTVHKFDKDIFYKLILEHEYKNLDDIKKFILNSEYTEGLLFKRTFYFAVYSLKTKEFTMIELQ